MQQKYSHIRKNGELESWDDISRRVAKNVLKSVDAKPSLIKEVEQIIKEKKFIPGGRYLYASGRQYHQTQNCLLLRAEDSREGWGQLLYNSSMALMTGAGIGVDYSDIRPEGKIIRKTGGTATGPLALAQMINEAGRGIMQGGARRSAIWAGLSWKHADIHKFITMKNWIPEVRDFKAKDFNFPANMDGTNISVQLDDEFFEAYHDEKHSFHTQAHSVYWSTIRQMLKTGEPGFSIDLGENKNETLRNACTEITSRDDSDICNLGSINLSCITDRSDMDKCVELASAFLLAGTVYSHVPYAKVDQIRSKNRRLGLGLMGMHEWLLQRGKKYGSDEELSKLLDIYASSTKYAHQYSKQWDLSKSVKTRAIAPTGSLAILGETTSGIEPLFCAAYKRRYRKGLSDWHFQYVIDPIAKKLVESGINPDSIEDAYSLADNIERRVEFQAWVQQYVDHGISSTINLPAWGSELNNESTVQSFGNMLIKYLPKLRGITVYPDGSRNGQPLTAVSYKEAESQIGNVFVEQSDVCDLSKGGSCGS